MTYGMCKIEIFLHFVALLIVEPGSAQYLERDFSESVRIACSLQSFVLPPLILSFTDHQDTDKKAC